MPSGVSKLQLLIDLKNNLKAGLDTAKQQVSRATGQMQAKLDAFKAKNIQLFDAIEQRVPGAASAVSMIANPYLIAAAAVLGLTLAVAKFTGMANRWREGLAEVNVTAGLTQSELEALSGKLLEIGGRNVAPLEEVPKAFNQIISAGLDVKQSLEALEPTLRASKAGFTDIAVAADAGVSVMNSSGRNINEVYDSLFQTVKAGKAEFRDVAAYLPKIIPMARNAGFALGETAGAWAFLTAQGQTAERATTLAQNAFKAISDPERIKAFQLMGINLYDATGKVKPLVDIIDQLKQKTNGMSDLAKANFYGRLGLDSEAASFFAASTQDAAKLGKIINEVTNSQGALNKAYEDSKQPLDSWREVWNYLKTLMIGVGNNFLPIIGAIGEGILSIVHYFKNLYAESALFRDSLSIIGILFAGLWKVVTAPVRAIVNLFGYWQQYITWVLGGLSHIFTKITGIEGGMSGFYNRIRPYLIWIKDMFFQIAGLMYDVFTLNIKGVKERISNFKLPDLAEIKPDIKVETSADGDFSGVPDTDPDKGSAVPTNNVASDIKTIGSGSQSKNVTINIDSFVKGFTPTHQSVNAMNKDEIERWMIEMFMRVVRSAEMAT